MKRMLARLTVLLFACALTACGQTASLSDSTPIPPEQSGTFATEDSSSPAPSAAPATSASEPASRVLVAYFSATGNTEGIALRLQSVLGADLYEILPEQPYTDEDLRYSNDSCRANQEQNDPSARPAITGPLPDPADYDVVFLGYPIWWGQAPKVIYTFLEGCDLGDAVIVPFCTSGSSGIGTSAENLHELAKEAQWREGQRFDAATDEDALAQWVDGLDLSL